MIKIGPSGNSKIFYEQGYKSTIQAGKWLAEQGLDCYEYSFGRGINISDATAESIGREFADCGVEISVHAPYYINFANPSDEMAEKSYNYVINSCKKLACFGGNRVVFHPSTVGKMTRQDAVQLTHKRLNILAEKIESEGLANYIFCPETMGKINQIGDVAEIVGFCNIHDSFVPCIDFGHINARTYGSLKTKQDYLAIIDYMIDNLGFDKTSNMHIHFSKIEYSKGGEVKHLTFDDMIYGPEFEPLAEVISQYKLQPYIVCESDGTQSIDALTMRKLYNDINNN